MKHSISITSLFVFLFLASQLVGLFLVYLHGDVSVVDGVSSISYGETAVGPRPDASPGQIFLVIALGVGIGTALLLVFIKYKMFNLWKLWFFAAVFLSLFIAFGVFMLEGIAFLLGLLLAAWKIFRPNAIVHNTTELFVYSGIVILVSPLFDLLLASILLIAISVYDMYAVWKSKHMVTLASASTKNNLLAGLYIPKTKKLLEPPSPPKKGKMAVLGGGDIAFPLLFSSVVFTWLVNTNQILPFAALTQTILISVFCTVILACLYAYGKKGTFYPAMPFLSACCFLGLGVISLL